MDGIYRFFNANPSQKIVKDCVKRSIALLTGKSYHDVSLELNRLKATTGATKFNDNANWETYVARLGWPRTSYKAVAGQLRMNGERFCLSHPRGKFLLRMAHHLTAVIDGKIYDTWDCSGKCVYASYEVN